MLEAAEEVFDFSVAARTQKTLAKVLVRAAAAGIMLRKRTIHQVLRASHTEMTALCLAALHQLPAFSSLMKPLQEMGQAPCRGCIVLGMALQRLGRWVMMVGWLAGRPLTDEPVAWPLDWSMALCGKLGRPA